MIRIKIPVSCQTSVRGGNSKLISMVQNSSADSRCFSHLSGKSFDRIQRGTTFASIKAPNFNHSNQKPLACEYRPFSSRSRVRRRRRSGSTNTPFTDESHVDDERTSANKPTDTIQDGETFIKLSQEFLHRAENALEPMKHHNDVFNLVRSSNEDGDNLTVALKPGEGSYVLQINNEMCTLSLNSPMSGTYTYVLCAYTGQFVGMEDGHSCEGMLVRDLIRHCNGLPHF